MSDLLTEQRIITNFIAAIFNAIVNQRNRALRATMERDPEFKRIVARLERSRMELHDWAERQAEGDPEARKDLEMVRKLLSR